MIGYDHEGRPEYLNELHKTASSNESKESKTPASEHNKYTKDPGHKDEVGEPQKKESALLGQIREIAKAAATSASAS
jgi:hypothetical protein